MNQNLSPAPAAPEFSVDRRSFLRLTALAGGGFMLGFYFKSAGSLLAADAPGAAAAEFAPSSWIRIAANGAVTLYSSRPEIGQGIKTSLPMVLAEELDVDWKSVTVVSEPLDSSGTLDGAGGSTSVPTSYAKLRQLGATARAVLVEAAAQTWGVPAASCTTMNGAVFDATDNKKMLTYGELVAKAATLPVPAKAPLKDPKDFKLLGTRVPNVDNAAIATGQRLFGLDVKQPGMLYAVLEKCPVFGGSVTGANLDEVKALPGVKDVFLVNERAVNGVAIVATSTWAAFSARKQLKLQLNEGAGADHSWASFSDQARALGAKAVDADGEIFNGAAKVLEGAYSFPYISHTNLEPQNCTVHFKGDHAEVWAPTQSPQAVRSAAASALGLNGNQITLHVTRSGGGFGRRLSADYASDAAAIAKHFDVPVKLTWSREDDLHHDLYRPAGFNFLKGGIDAAGKIVAWRNFTVGFSANAGGGGGRRGGGGGGEFPGGFVPATGYQARSGAVTSLVPTGAWRAPGDCTAAWVVQSFIDELAHASGRDLVEFKLDLLATKLGNSNWNNERMIGCVKLAAEKAGWGKKLPRGQGMGIAFHFCHQGYAAHVAEVTVSPAGDLKVNRVVAAIDVGSQILNLSSAENQVEGAITDGLSAGGYQSLNLEKGRIVENNLADYPMLRIADAPEKIEVHFLKTAYDPTGLGEPAFPPLAPAVCNAIFAATGKRIRALPFSATDLKWS